jgi:3-hydroxybutyrate dehydrogenase
VLALSLTAPFLVTQQALPTMKAKGWGRIINIASVHGQVGSTGKAPYVSSKHGLVGLTKVTALETAGSGVTCNAICPGWVHTPLVQKQIEARCAGGRVGRCAPARGALSADPARRRSMAAMHLDETAATQSLLKEKQPSGQFAQASDIGALALFLCSDAAAQITGSNVTIDGGWTAQ